MEDTGSSVIAEWTVEDVSKKIQQTYNDEVAKKFEEQKIDGRALKLLAKEGSTDQLAACGLETVGDQLRLKEVASLVQMPEIIIRGKKKPTIKQVKAMSDLDQRIYKAKRKAVTVAALQKWPGNNIPIFKKDIAASKELEKLVSSIEEKCCFEPAGFNGEAIKQHILDVFNERRRRLRRGHDYTLPDKRTLKKAKTSSDETSSETQDGGDTDILNSSGSSSEANSVDAGSDNDRENESTGTGQALTLKSAKVIITVMFSAIRYQDVTRQQVMSALKLFKVKYCTSSKDDLAMLLAEVFLKHNYVKVDKENLSNIGRDDVKKLKVF